MRRAEIGVASDPLGVGTAIAKVRLLDTIGRHDEAKRRIDAFGEPLTTLPGSAYYRWRDWRFDDAVSFPVKVIRALCAQRLAGARFLLHGPTHCRSFARGACACGENMNIRTRHGAACKTGGAALACALATMAAPIAAETTVASGTPSTEWSGVGALLTRISGGGYAECTATLISPTWVLTAAHCLDASANPADYVFVPQADYSCCTDSGGLAVSSIIANPQYTTSPLPQHDEALVQLAAPLTGVTPLLVNDQSPPAAGNYLHLLGYGLTDAGNNTLKERGLVQITSLDGVSITFDAPQPYSQSCPGDSGGPSYAYAPNGFPIVYGTVSYGYSGLCSTSTGTVSSRIDVDSAWILSQATDACRRSAPGGSGCDGIFRSGIESLAIAPAAPVVTLQPLGLTIPEEWIGSFSAAASGDPPPTVQWQASPDGNVFSDIPGATASTLLAYAYPGINGAHFHAVFTNAVSTATTNDAVMNVLPPDDYNPANCDAVKNTLDIFWEAVGGSATGCFGIEYTDGSLADAADGSFSMNGVSVSNPACISTAKYTFTVSGDKQTLSGADTLANIPMSLALTSDQACYVGRWVSGSDIYVATIWAFPTN